MRLSKDNPEQVKEALYDLGSSVCFVAAKCIEELQSTETRLNNLIGTATTETENRSLSDDETPVFRSVKDEDDGKEK